MSETLDRLHQEHKDLARLLDILEAELARFDAAGTPDYEVMLAIADYFTDYPAACHHPKEDLVYNALVARRPELADSIGDIVSEHVSLGNQVKQFADAVHNVLQDVNVSRDAFDHVVRNFVTQQRRHIDLEEGRFFPLAAETLSNTDWAEIDGRIADRDDPLFGNMPEERFAVLRQDIETWEDEDSR